MKAICKNPQISSDLDGNWRISFDVWKESVSACKNGNEELKGIARIAVTAEREKKKRSLDANAYAWVLIGNLSAKLRISKEEVYRQTIKDIGGNFEITPIRTDAVETWVGNWQGRGLGWVCDILGESKLCGYKNVVNYFGSSSYDTGKMASLIDFLVSECNAQGIETMTPQELGRLKEGWR